MTEKNDLTLRAGVLNEARDLITGDRNNTYGPPHQDFQHTADMMTALGFTQGGEPVKAHHVAMILACVKLSRLAWTPGKRDSWVDLAGYAACGLEAEVLTREENRPLWKGGYGDPEPPEGVNKLRLLDKKMTDSGSTTLTRNLKDGGWYWLHPSGHIFSFRWPIAHCPDFQFEEIRDV